MPKEPISFPVHALIEEQEDGSLIVRLRIQQSRVKTDQVALRLTQALMDDETAVSIEPFICVRFNDPWPVSDPYSEVITRTSLG